MAPSTLISLIALCLLCSPSPLSFAAKTTSALPPSSSSHSPASSPDITPLFPSPSKGELSPTEASLPIIPSSPSPPNPDDITSFGPNTMAISPSGSQHVSSAVSWSFGTSIMVAVSSIVLFMLATIKM
ncbi:putative classical arabinogalactan protein [Helianthus annuus]|nr:putative classical arabinogalactan protein [Helianthus annuus]KAJ0871236.1 putative classical arabinogalactan protein [Helianthus annuus]